MGLDATVYCDCFERGRLRTAPLPQWGVHVGDTGARFSRTRELEDGLAFDRWNRTACDHEDGVLLHQYLGNIARVGLVREALSARLESFPILLGRVVYDGIHGGDWLSIEQVEALQRELVALTCFRPADERHARCVRYFEEQLNELVTVALQLGKPIAF
jgi:hypothetical protein